MGTIEDRDTAFIWLRQTAEVSLGDQRRTLEIAVPVRLGATHDEITRALDAAENGMERLAERMDRCIAALHGSGTAPQATETLPVEPAPVAASPTPKPAVGIAERPSAPRPAPAPGPAPSPAPGPPRATAQPTPAMPSGAPGALSRPEFLEQARGLGLTPRQVMERLGVRTLEGLNYGEALEQIKRQLLREGLQPSQDGGGEPAHAPLDGKQASQPMSPPAAPADASHGAVRYFDEEDDFDATFEVSEDDGITELDLDALDVPSASARARSEQADDDDDPDLLEMDDVPDFATASAARSTERTTTAQPPAAAHPTSSGTANNAESRPIPVTHQALAQRARARELLVRLREIRGGAPAGADQLGPFTNIVVQELGEPTVAALTDQVWGVASDQLSSQQMRALIQWGKTDAFAAEVSAVLELLAAERAGSAPSEPQSPSARGARPGARSAARGSGSAR